MKSLKKTLLVCLCASVAAMGLAVSVSAQTNNTMLISENQSTTTALRPNVDTSTSSSTRTTKPVVSFGLRVMAAREQMVLTGLCGNEISFTSEDICRAMNISELEYITIEKLPAPSDGTLFVGATGAAVGQTVTAGSLSLMSFAAADDTTPSDAEMTFSVNGNGYAMTCKLCLLENLNYTPTVSLAPSVSLRVSTYRDLPLVGALSAYDPEGDEVTFEIVRYAAHGRVKLDDRNVGAYTYTPDEGFTGEDEFQYVVRDEYGNYSTAAIVRVTVSPQPSNVTFADIDGASCAADIIRITAAGIMNGTRVGNDSYFKPTEAMSRAEFLVTAMHAAGINADTLAAAGLSETSTTSYADNDNIPASMRGYVTLATQRGYVSGKQVSGTRCFLPDETISRAEASVILSNIIGYAKQTTVTAFADADEMPAWSQPAMTSLRALGILAPTDGNASASIIMTRGETAQWLCRTMQLMSGE